ncbi:MAG: SGNH/GDSL hydrolase family protein [Imperialibacter sp.]|uniref:SGNH/GDSL hydrolase family protein n=1 Tax=Imperialibacter sp. TaxID=2038411 RepID=UPI003A848AED
MKNHLVLPLLLIISMLAGCSQLEKLKIEADNQQINYTGRIDFGNPKAPVLFWSGSEATLTINGTGLRVELADEGGDNYFNIVIDKDSIRYIRLDSATKWYTLAKDLEEGEHTISLIKRNEWDKGSTTIHGFEVTGELLPTPENSRTIEFIGNSITAGYAIEDLTGGDSPDSVYTNNYPTYGAITARNFNADYVCTCRSGIGVMISWDPTIIMPEVFPRLNPRDSASRWDFSHITPDLVVVNLFQNDSWLVNMPEQPSFSLRLGEAAPGEEEIIASYQEFISMVRNVYPDTPIICALGSMDATKEGSAWPGYVQEAVDGLGDSLIYTHFFPFIEKGGHPRVADNKKMAGSLTSFIREKLKW